MCRQGLLRRASTTSYQRAKLHPAGQAARAGEPGEEDPSLPQGAALGSRGDAFLVQSFPQALGEIREARQDLRSVTAHGRRYDRLQKSRRNLRILLFAFPKEVGTFHYRRMAYAIMTFL